jgi:hypothetical protein
MRLNARRGIEDLLRRNFRLTRNRVRQRVQLIGAPCAGTRVSPILLRRITVSMGRPAPMTDAARRWPSALERRRSKPSRR